jgi:hypothetical protein
VLPRPMTTRQRIARPSRRSARTVRGRARAAAPQRSAAQPALARPEVVRRSNERARNIMGSVCQGC